MTKEEDQKLDPEKTGKKEIRFFRKGQRTSKDCDYK
jgi:hypothetical protein